MNWHHIVTIYLKELKDSLRDRRTLISMIVVPTLVMPLLMFGVGTIMAKIMKKAQAEVSAIMVVGGEDSPGVTTALREARGDDGHSARFHVVPFSADYRQLISNKKIRAAVEIPAGFEAALKKDGAGTVTVFYYQDELNSSIGARQIESFFSSLRERTVEARLVDHHLPAGLVRPFETRRQNVAPPEKIGGNTLGGFIPYMIIILCVTGAAYPAIDLTAGEKERGTMETLLCSPVSRINIVAGKFLMVLTASITTMLLSLVSMGVSALVGLGLLGGSGMQAAQKTAARVGDGSAIPTIDPVGLVGVFGMVAPTAIFFAAVMLTISLFAKSYKEAQSYLQPLLIVVILPAVVGMLPGIELTAKTALVPILSLSLVCKEMLSGVWHWQYISLIFASSCAYAAVAMALAVRMFNREDVIFRM